MKKLRLFNWGKDDGEERVKIDVTKIEDIRQQIEKQSLPKFQTSLVFSKKKTENKDMTQEVSFLIDCLGDKVREFYNEFTFPFVKVLQFFTAGGFDITKEMLITILQCPYIVELKVFPTDPINGMTLEIHLSSDPDYKNQYIVEDIEKVDDIKIKSIPSSTTTKGTEIIVKKISDIFDLDVVKKPLFPVSEDPDIRQGKFYLSGQVNLSQIRKCLADRTVSDFRFNRDNRHGEKYVYYVFIKVPAIGDFKEEFKL